MVIKAAEPTEEIGVHGEAATWTSSRVEEDRSGSPDRPAGIQATDAKPSRAGRTLGTKHAAAAGVRALWLRGEERGSGAQYLASHPSSSTCSGHRA